MSGRKWTVTTAAGLLVVALALRLHGLGWGLPQIYEEAYPFKKSWDMWGWGPGQKFALNPHFFNYPTFYFYVQLLGQGLLYLALKLRGVVHSTLDYRVLYALDKTSFYLVGRGMSALFGAGTVLVTFAIGRRLGGLAVAAGAAALVAVNAMHIEKSQVIEVDVPLTFFAMLCCFFALRILERPERRDYLWAGLSAGLATSTKYSGGLLPLLILLAHLLSGRYSFWPAGAGRGAGVARRGAASRLRPGDGTLTARPPWSHLAIAAAACVSSLFLTSPYILLDRTAFWEGFNYERLHMRIGHFGLDTTPASIYYLHVLTGSLLGWPLALLGGAGLAYFLGVRRRSWAAVLIVFPIVYVALISSWSMKAERYILPLMPIACLFALMLVVEFTPRLRRFATWAPAAASAALVGILAAPSLAGSSRYLERSRPDTRTLAKQWIEAHYPGGSFILTESYGPEPFSALDLANLDEDVRERIRKERPDVKVYPVLQLPMYQVMPEVSSVFYDLRLYDDLPDLVVTSSSVSTRYRREPQRFAVQLAFYDSLQARYVVAREFGAADGYGPHLTLYRNPRQSLPFAQRPSVPLPSSDWRPAELYPGTCAPFYRRLGLDYETYGFDAAAATAYLIGQQYSERFPDQYRDLTLGAARCWMRAHRPEAVFAVLDAAVRHAATPGEAEYWRQLRQKVTTATQEGGATAPPTGSAPPSGSPPATGSGGAAPDGKP